MWWLLCMTPGALVLLTKENDSSQIVVDCLLWVEKCFKIIIPMWLEVKFNILRKIHFELKYKRKQFQS